MRKNLVSSLFKYIDTYTIFDSIKYFENLQGVELNAKKFTQQVAQDLVEAFRQFRELQN